MRTACQDEVVFELRCVEDDEFYKLVDFNLLLGEGLLRSEWGSW